MTRLLKMLLPLLVLLVYGCSHERVPNTPPPKLQHLTKEEMYIQDQKSERIMSQEAEAYKRTNSMPLNAWNR